MNPTDIEKLPEAHGLCKSPVNMSFVVNSGYLKQFPAKNNTVSELNPIQPVGVGIGKAEFSVQI